MSNSTAVLTDLNTLDTTSFTSVSKAKSSSSTGDNIDLDGMAHDAYLKATELKQVLTLIVNNTDSGDAQHTLASNIAATIA